jgi:hypothetical protein
MVTTAPPFPPISAVEEKIEGRKERRKEGREKGIKEGREGGRKEVRQGGREGGRERQGGRKGARVAYSKDQRPGAATGQEAAARAPQDFLCCRARGGAGRPLPTPCCVNSSVSIMQSGLYKAPGHV